MIREGPTEEIGVTLTGQFLGETSASVVIDKGKAIDVGRSQNSSATPTDPEIQRLLTTQTLKTRLAWLPKGGTLLRACRQGLQELVRVLKLGLPQLGGRRDKKRKLFAMASGKI